MIALSFEAEERYTVCLCFYVFRVGLAMTHLRCSVTPLSVQDVLRYHLPVLINRIRPHTIQ